MVAVYLCVVVSSVVFVISIMLCVMPLPFCRVPRLVVAVAVVVTVFLSSCHRRRGGAFDVGRSSLSYPCLASSNGVVVAFVVVASVVMCLLVCCLRAMSCPTAVVITIVLPSCYRCCGVVGCSWLRLGVRATSGVVSMSTRQAIS